MHEDRPTGQGRQPGGEQISAIDDRAAVVDGEVQGRRPRAGGEDHHGAGGNDLVQELGGGFTPDLNDHTTVTALVGQPVAEAAHPLPPGTDGGPDGHPPGLLGPLEHPDPGPAAGEHACALEAGHAGADDQRVGIEVLGALWVVVLGLVAARGSPTQVTMGLRTSSTWQAWLQSRHGRRRRPSPERSR